MAGKPISAYGRQPERKLGAEAPGETVVAGETGMAQPLRENAVDSSGQEYLRTLPTDARRSGGLVYTPNHLVDFVLAVAGYTPDEAIEPRLVLDTACGAGAFLLGAIQRLAARHSKTGTDLRSPRGRRAFLESVGSRSPWFMPPPRSRVAGRAPSAES